MKIQYGGSGARGYLPMGLQAPSLIGRGNPYLGHHKRMHYGNFGPQASEASAFRRTISTGQVKVLEGLVVMDLKVITRLPNLGPQLGGILLLPLHQPSVPMLGMVADSMVHQISLLPSTPPMGPLFKALVNSNKFMDSSPSIHQPLANNLFNKQLLNRQQLQLQRDWKFVLVS